jgi:hypothetical protein
MVEISIDADGAVAACSERLLAIFGQDEFTKNLKARVARLTQEGVADSRYVQSVGMKRPVPIELIYQPSRVASEELSARPGNSYSFDQLLDFTDSVVVQGAPGAGKTTLAHRLYRELLRSNRTCPLLFTLRRKESVEDLGALVESSRKLRSSVDSQRDIVWIADGYDELPRGDRKKVSRFLSHLERQGLGRFILTCRSHYEVIDLRARYLYVQPFSEQEAVEYIRAFCRTYGATFDPVEFARDLIDRGFADFLSNPLMLTLACILRTSRAQALPRHTLSLVRRALNVLTYEWDESKDVAREAAEPVEGEERIRCLKRIAFAFEKPTGSEEVALRETREQLRLMQYSKVNPSKLLRETAQWYGLFVPTASGEWSFSHKTIHDYLAAQHWVDTGAFSQAMTVSTWNTRVAYAACLLQDSTRLVIAALQRAEGMEMLIECLLNGAAFDQRAVAMALARRLVHARYRGQFQQSIAGSNESLVIKQVLPDDFLRFASEDFLSAMMEVDSVATFGLAMSEILRRNLRYTKLNSSDLRTATFTVVRGKQLKLVFRGDKLLER